jgi:hypothetical protein
MVNLYQENPPAIPHGREKSANPPQEFKNVNMGNSSLLESNWTSTKTSLKVKSAMKITNFDAIQPSYAEKLKKNVPDMEQP